MIRFAVIGTNWITEKFIEASKQTGEFTLAAVYSRSEDKAREFAAKYGEGAELFTDLRELAASDRFEAVYLASPNSFHAEQAILLMKHGKHVLCEKPIASNSRELAAMIAAACENRVVLMEAMKSAFMPGFQAVRQNLHKIGPVTRYFASYCQYSSRYDAYKQGTVLNAFNPMFSNGSLMDLGIYCIYPLAALFGKPERLSATGLLLESGVDGQGSLILNYKRMDAVIMHAKIANSSLPAEIQGDEGTIVIDKISEPDRVHIRYRDGSIEELTQPRDKASMYYEAKEFIEAVKSGQPESSMYSHAASMTVMEIIDEARRQIGLVFPADLA